MRCSLIIEWNIAICVILVGKEWRKLTQNCWISVENTEDPISSST